MSLLMDALKKAEQEKKKAAEKLKQSAEQDQPESGVPGPAQPSSKQAAPADQKKPAARAGLELEPIEPAGEITDEFTIVDDYAPQADEDSDLNISIDRMPADRADEDEFEQTGKQPIPGAAPAMTSALREELDDDRNDGTFYGVELEGEESDAAMYEETLQGEPYVSKEPPQLYDETLPGVSAVELARDIGDENQPTPVAAQTIFAASASRRSSSGIKWAIGVLVCIIAIVIALGVVFYQSESITPRKLPSPLVARGIEDIVPAQTLAAAQAQARAQAKPITGTLIQARETPPAAAPAAAKPPPAPEQVPAAETAQAAAGAAAPAEQGGGSTAATAEQAAAAPVTPALAPGPALAAAPKTPPPQQLPAQIEVTHALLKISKSRGPDKSAIAIKAAYDAYQAGNYAEAKEKYARIIKDFPDSRDGLLGLAAIAMYQHDWKSAFHLYSHLLTIDPANTTAKAALINLMGDSGQADRESTIKLMLNASPKSSYLYYSLGNVYASQLRWADAQQAYFDAYRYDNTNSNYALNLAIALDRMGQRKTALDYYNTALKLSSGKQSEFDVAKVQARIKAISTSVN